MPANIERFYGLREPAWHGLGFVAQEEMSLQEALVAADMDFSFEMSPVYTSVLSPDGVTSVPLRNKSAVVRTNKRTGDVRAFGPTSNNYKIHTVPQMFSLAENMLGEGAVVDTIGSLGFGERMFLTLILPVDINVPDDKMGMYMTATTGFDGSTATRYDMTPIRIVCANTWAAAHAASEAKIKFRHTSSLEGKEMAAATALGLAQQYAEVIEAQARSLLAVSLRDEDAAQVIATLFPFPESIASAINTGKFNIDFATPAEKRAITTTQESRHTVFSLYKDSPTKATPNTGWGLLNAVTEYADHFTPIRTRDSVTATERRFERIIDGQFDDLKDRAADLILAGI